MYRPRRSRGRQSFPVGANLPCYPVKNEMIFLSHWTCPNFGTNSNIIRLEIFKTVAHSSDRSLYWKLTRYIVQYMYGDSIIVWIKYNSVISLNLHTGNELWNAAVTTVWLRLNNDQSITYSMMTIQKADIARVLIGKNVRDKPGPCNNWY